MVTRGGFEVIRGGRGFSTRTLERGDVVLREVNRTPQITKEGNTVFIDGQGFSVEPGLQDEFIKQQISIGSPFETRMQTTRRVSAFNVAKDLAERQKLIDAAEEKAKREALITAEKDIAKLARTGRGEGLSQVQIQRETQEIMARAKKAGSDIGTIGTRQDQIRATIGGKTFEELKGEQVKKTFIEKILDLPPLKFARGELEFQKKIEEKFTDRKKDLGLTDTQISNISSRLGAGEKNVKVNGRTFFIDEKGGISARRDLPFGLQKVVDLEPGVVSGKEPTLFTLPNVFARKFVSSKAGKNLLAKIREKNPGIADFLEAPSPTATRISEVITLVELGLFFDPAFQVGVAAKGAKGAKAKAVVKAAKKANGKISKSSVQNDLLFKLEGNILRPKTNAEKIDDISGMIKKIF